MLNDINDVKLEKNEFLSDEEINVGICSNEDFDDKKMRWVGLIIILNI